MHNLYIHIGAGKCGSSATQTFLRQNRDVLDEAGVLVPTTKLTPDGSRFGRHVQYF